MLSFLPDKLNLDGQFENMLKLCYNVFTTDIITPNFKFQGLRVFVDNRKIDSPFEEGFWHIITRGKDEERTIDYKRAKRITWLRPLVDNYQNPEILYWIENTSDKKGRIETHYIWYKEGKYLIILKYRGKRNYFLATAYYVFGRNIDYFQKKYKKFK